MGNRMAPKLMEKWADGAITAYLLLNWNKRHVFGFNVDDDSSARWCFVSFVLASVPAYRSRMKGIYLKIYILYKFKFSLLLIQREVVIA